MQKIDAMPVEKLANYAEWRAARDAVYAALKAAQELERAERRITRPES